MRKFHRWIMTVFTVLLSYWVVSGLTLAIYDLTDSKQEWAVDGGGAGARTPQVVDGFELSSGSPIAASDVAPMTTNTMAALNAVASDQPLTAIELNIVNGIHQAIVSIGAGPTMQRLRFDAQTGNLLERSANMDKWLDLPPPSLHSTLKNWHRGNVIGGSGVVLALFTAVAVLLLSITGIVLYIELWRRRKAIDRQGFFWKDNKLSLRSLHRWLSIVAAAFLLHLSITGMILAWSSIRLEPPSAPRVAFSREEVLPLMTELYTASRNAVPDAPLVSLRLRMFVGQPFGLPLFGGDKGGLLAIQPLTGGYVISYSGSSLGNAKWDTHTWIKRLHRGDFIGSFNGRFIAIGAGLSLLFLLISGVKMYFDLWSRRRSSGRRSLFWS